MLHLLISIEAEIDLGFFSVIYFYFKLEIDLPFFISANRVYAKFAQYVSYEADM